MVASKPHPNAVTAAAVIRLFQAAFKELDELRPYAPAEASGIVASIAASCAAWSSLSATSTSWPCSSWRYSVSLPSSLTSPRCAQERSGDHAFEHH